MASVCPPPPMRPSKCNDVMSARPRSAVLESQMQCACEPPRGYYNKPSPKRGAPPVRRPRTRGQTALQKTTRPHRGMRRWRGRGLRRGLHRGWRLVLTGPAPNLGGGRRKVGGCQIKSSWSRMHRRGLRGLRLRLRRGQHLVMIPSALKLDGGRSSRCRRGRSWLRRRLCCMLIRTCR